MSRTEMWWTEGIRNGWLGRYETELVYFLREKYGRLTEEQQLAVVFLSLFLKAGHTTLPLHISPRDWGKIIGLPPESIGLLPAELVHADDLTQNGKLASASLQEYTPLTVTEDRVSFRKQFLYETFISDWISVRNAEQGTKYAPERISEELGKLYPEVAEESEVAGKMEDSVRAEKTEKGEDTEEAEKTKKREEPVDSEEREAGEKAEESEVAEKGKKSEETDWQKVAAAHSASRTFTIISGGPGTGKTTTVANLLAMHIRLADAPLNIALAAPTGKAAGRMAEALQNQWSRIGLTDAEKEQIPAEASTIHRLLSGTERRGLLPPARRKRLPYDLIVVDEASMIDLQLMYRLLYHTDERATLILLGDRNQLASVEAGSVFSDLCTKQENSFRPDTAAILRRSGVEHDLPIGDSDLASDSIVYLTKSYRYHEQSGIGQLSAAILSGETHRAEELFEQYEDLYYHPFGFGKEDLIQLADEIRQEYAVASAIAGAEELLRYWKRVMRLTVLRHGPSGSQRLNSFAEQQILLQRPGVVRNGWYHGRPFIVTKNDYSLGIFNGDTGVAVLSEDGELKAHVESGSRISVFSPGQLMHIEPAYFLTVHKSQGSEFDHVHLLLPLADTPVLSRELIYTAISRARRSFHLKGDLDLFSKGSLRKTERYTGFPSLRSG